MVTLNMPLVSSNEASKSKASNPYEPKDLQITLNTMFFTLMDLYDITESWCLHLLFVLVFTRDSQLHESQLKERGGGAKTTSFRQ